MIRRAGDGMRVKVGDTYLVRIGLGALGSLVSLVSLGEVGRSDLMVEMKDFLEPVDESDEVRSLGVSLADKMGAPPSTM